MDKVALLPAQDRAALFGESGALRGMANTIVEKDFWVCWTLKRLFAVQGKETASLVFKGGTSLSKAYAIIERFSEDIDLTIIINFNRELFSSNKAMILAIKEVLLNEKQNLAFNESHTI